MHIGALAVLEAGPLVDVGGRLDLDGIRARRRRRLQRTAVLMKVLHHPGFLAPAGPVVAVDVESQDALNRAQAVRIGEANAKPASDAEALPLGDRPSDGGQRPR